MKLKLYIITYNNNDTLNKCLESLNNSIIPHNVILDKFIINNHTNISINNNYYNDVILLNNNLRPDFSTGHLSRNWNQAIINGFKDILNPDCDILITCQVDTIFSLNWVNEIIKHHEKYNLFTASWGDGFISYTIDAIKNIGLWDERFCTIEYQEADYFIRALIYNKEYSSINDFHHGRVLNKELKDDSDQSIVYRYGNDIKTHLISSQFNKYNLNLMNRKYGNFWLKTWDQDYINNPPKILIDNYITYPYFEKDILNLKDKYVLEI